MIALFDVSRTFDSITDPESTMDQVAAKEPLKAGTKSDGLGRAVFHAAAKDGFSVCGKAYIGGAHNLMLASEISSEMRCKSKACQAAFRDAGV